MAETLLENVAYLAPHARRLKQLGYRSLEQFVGSANAAGSELGRYLDVDINSLLANLPQEHAPLLAKSRAYSKSPLKFSLGARLRQADTKRVAFAAAPIGIPLPTQVNWVSQMPPIKDQGARGCCVAFASLAVVEHYSGTQNAYKDLSEQFLYWDCKSNDGDPNNEGTWLHVSFPRLQIDGCCLESTWPYNPSNIPGNEGQGPPPSGATAEALLYKVAQINPLPATSIQSIKSELARNRCVAFSIPVFNSWYLNNQVQLTGDIILPIPGETEVNGHAMCLVGYFDDTTNSNPALGGGVFILRNSWNSQWGTQCTYGVGYGTIPYAYIASYADEAYSVY